MCLEDQATAMVNARETFSKAASKCSLGATIQSVLRSAQSQQRLTVGLLPALQRLSSARGCELALFCLLAPARPGDAANHMQEVLLQAFCRENDIYIVKVDSAEKLHKLMPSYNLRDLGCVLVHQPYTDPYSDHSPSSNFDHLSPPDRLLAEHCEGVWGIQPTPIIRLPEQ